MTQAGSAQGRLDSTHGPQSANSYHRTKNRETALWLPKDTVHGGAQPTGLMLRSLHMIRLTLCMDLLCYKFCQDLVAKIINSFDDFCRSGRNLGSSGSEAFMRL